MKNGAPNKAIAVPIGTKTPLGKNLNIRAAPMIIIPEIQNKSSLERTLESPNSKRIRWGLASPINPIFPEILTLIANPILETMRLSALILLIGTPTDSANSSPVLSIAISFCLYVM